MGWVKLDDQFIDNPKLAQLSPVGPLCGWQFVAIISWCNRYLTDGKIPKAKAHGLVDWSHIQYETGGTPGIMSVGEDADGKAFCELLLAAGHLEESEDGFDYQVHDYLDYQPSRAEKLAERAENAKRQKDFRDRKRNVPYNGVTTAVSNADSNGASNRPPVPVPLSNTNSSESTQSNNADADAKPARNYRVDRVSDLLDMTPEQIRESEKADREHYARLKAEKR